jgi:hypothetical protein
MTTTEAVGLIGTYLEIKNILHGLEFLLVSAIEPSAPFNEVFQAPASTQCLARSQQHMCWVKGYGTTHTSH